MTIPIPVLDDRTFDQLVSETMARVPVHTPEWTSLTAADPGVTLVDLFAFLTENLLYRSNRIPEANRLKFLTLLGISLEPPTPGTGLVTISNDKGPLAPTPLVEGSRLWSGSVPFETTTDLDVLPVTSAVYVKRPRKSLDDAAQQRYQLIYQTFLSISTDVLSFYAPELLDLPATGAPDPVVDLGDADTGSLDRALWVALLARKGERLEDTRLAIGGKTLTLGVYPAAQVDGRVLPPLTVGSADTDPGLVVEIAAPAADPSGLAGPGFGIGPANYRALSPSYADPVLQSPGIISVTLPAAKDLLVWAYDPEEEGTGDYPPRVDDDDVNARIVSWLRLRLPPSAQEAAAARDQGDAGSATATVIGGPSQAPIPAAGSPAAGTRGCGCGCGSAATATSLLPSSGPGADPGPDAGPGTTTALAVAAAASGPAGRITWVGVNSVPVLQSATLPEERLGTGTGTPFQTFVLANTPVLTDRLTVTVQPLQGTRTRWDPIDDIYAAGPDELRYVCNPATGQLTFGSGLTGARVPLGAVVTARYSYGGGLQGQLPIGSITKSATLGGGFTVTNPVPTWGAGAGESVAEGEAAITRWLRHRDRLVTADDFADLTRRTPGVDLARVDVLPLFNPDQPATGSTWPGLVTIMVVPRSDPLHANAPTPDRQFLAAVCRWLEPRRLITTELRVQGPVYRPVWVSVGIQVLPGEVPSLVQRQVRAAVEAYLSPLVGGLPRPATDEGLLAPLPAGRGWPLATELRSQDVEAVATRVPGVRFVESVRMAVTDAGGVVVGDVNPITMTGLELPSATVFTTIGPAQDPAALIGSSQPAPATQVAVPVVPPTC